LFCFAFRHARFLPCGDALPHSIPARRCFASLPPGPLQLGPVWLPLPHLLMMPFLVSDPAWQTGLGGSVPSLFAFVAATIGIYRLALDSFKVGLDSDISVRLFAWIAAAVFAANPSLMYLQTTAMTEPLYLAF